MQELLENILQSPFIYHFLKIVQTKEFIIICAIVFFIRIATKRKIKPIPGITIDDKKWEWDGNRKLWIYPIAIDVRGANNLAELENKESSRKVSIYLAKRNRSIKMPETVIIETKK